MRKYLILAVILLLAACGGSEPATGNLEPDAAAPETDTPQPDNDNGSDSGGQAEVPADPGDVSGIREQDWVRGSSDPAVTIIEYGDFQ